ncbi:uncharacterized protein LOC128856619 [Anastrepha ludens]|uniref:uncharacterized protein LOC128856619 n=1 Tax=Anastrepha ludens TaxID=28586 RepID=UPI0023B151B6|nr:uncharacterized protein LOC128856619 [Anastrepha ludens]
MKLLTFNIMSLCALVACITFTSAQQTFYPALKVRQVPALVNGQLSLVVNSVELAQPRVATRDAQGRPLVPQQRVPIQLSRQGPAVSRNLLAGQSLGGQQISWQPVGK